MCRSPAKLAILALANSKLVVMILAGLISGPVFAGLGGGLTVGLTLDHDGRTRSYDVYVPGGSGPYPLVVDMHAFGSRASDQRAVSRFRELADRHGFIVAWPEGGGAWNPTLGAPGFVGATRNDDVGFLRRMVDAIAEDAPVDRKRVYATGWSSGGEMAQALACAATDVFAAAAPLAATFPSGFEDFCNPVRPMPILMFRSDNDKLVPYSGGTGTQFNASTISASATLDFWRRTNACTQDIRSENPGSATRCDYHENCAAGVAAGLCTIRSSGDDGHRVYQTVDGVRPAELAWAFFSRHRLPDNVEPPAEFAINAGLTGAWFNPETPGQGLLIEPVPSSETLFAAWFTFDETTAKLGAPEQRWFTLQGSYEGAGADLEIFAIRGGAFAVPSEVEILPVGAARMEFSDCTSGTLDYAFDDGPAGTIALTRLTPDTLCGADTAADGVATVARPKGLFLNEGLSGAWLDPAAPGQGLLFDVVPGSDLFFMAWFTFEAGGAAKLGESSNRWLTGQGGTAGPEIELVLTNTSGGAFDDAQPVAQGAVGQAVLAFSSCTSATLIYSMDSREEGEIPLVRLAPDVFCGNLSR